MKQLFTMKITKKMIKMKEFYIQMKLIEYDFFEDLYHLFLSGFQADMTLRIQKFDEKFLLVFSLYFLFVLFLQDQLQHFLSSYFFFL